MRSLMPFQRTSKAWLKNCVIESPTTSSVNVLCDNLVEVPMSAFGSRPTHSHPSAFGHCWTRAATGLGPLRDRKPPSNRELETPFLGEVGPTDWVVTLRGLGRAPRGLALAGRADRERPSQRQARP
jgi:hypothetical protein